MVRLGDWMEKLTAQRLRLGIMTVGDGRSSGILKCTYTKLQEREYNGRLPVETPRVRW
jgi:hypothetical protein